MLNLTEYKIQRAKSKEQNEKSKIQKIILSLYLLPFASRTFALCSLPFVFCILLFGFCPLIIAQTPKIIQQHIYGGGASERLYAIEQTADGGFIASGNTNSYIEDGDITDSIKVALGQIMTDPNNDCWVIKLDSNYKIQWERVFGANGFDGGLAVKQTPTGAYIVAGYLSSFGGDNSGVHPSHNGGTTKDALVTKLNPDGSTAWIKLMGGGGDDQFEKIEIMPDGGILLCGSTNSNDGDVPPNLYHDIPFDNNYGDAWLVKLDPNGNLLWQKVIGGENKDAFTGMDKTTDGNYILSGYTNSNVGDLKGVQFNYDRKAWIVKITPDGNILWQHVVGKTVNNIETRPYSILTSRSGDFYIGGVSAQDYSSTMDFFLAKFNSAGEFKWAKTYGGSGDDWARSLIHSTSDDGVFISGYTITPNDGDVSGYHADHDAWILHCDTSGNIVQKRVVGGTLYDYFWNSCNTSDGRAIFAGYTKSSDFDLTGIAKRGDLDGWIVELDWGNIITTVCQNDTVRQTRNVCSLNQVFTDSIATKKTDGCFTYTITQRTVSNKKDSLRISDVLCNPISNNLIDTLNLKSVGGCDSTVIVTHTLKRTGTSCDDGNPNTINDVLQTDCSCKGDKNPNSSNDLSITLTASPNTYKNWTVNTFTTTVRNLGSTDFTNIVVSFPYPKATVDGGSSTISTGRWLEYCNAMLCYEWRIPLIKSGDSAVFVQPLFVLQPDGSIIGTASIKSSVPNNTILINNTSTVVLKINQPIIIGANIALSKNQNSSFNGRIFPQPVKDLFYVAINSRINESIVFSCFDALGRTLWTENKTSSNDDVFEFNLSSASSGIYFLQARLNDGSVMTEKIIKN